MCRDKVFTYDERYFKNLKDKVNNSGMNKYTDDMKINKSDMTIEKLSFKTGNLCNIESLAIECLVGLLDGWV